MRELKEKEYKKLDKAMKGYDKRVRPKHDEVLGKGELNSEAENFNKIKKKIFEMLESNV